ncbi:MAG: hypothetical protein WC876_01960 [Candidatus Thermoplasmatota archaeon]
MSASLFVHEVQLTDTECQVIADACACAAVMGSDHPRIINRLGLYFTTLAPTPTPRKRAAEAMMTKGKR